MKKNLILALVATGAVAILSAGPVAHAAGAEKGGKTPEARGRDVSDSAKRAKDAATKGADASANPMMKMVQDSRLLDAQTESDLGRAASANGEVMAAAKEAASQASGRFAALTKARLTGLANLIDMPAIKKQIADAEAISDVEALASPAKKKQREDGLKVKAYLTLLMSAGKAATGWDPATVENLTFLLNEANDGITRGKSIADAMTAAQLLIGKSKEDGGKSVRLNLEDINKFCK